MAVVAATALRVSLLDLSCVLGFVSSLVLLQGSVSRGVSRVPVQAVVPGLRHVRRSRLPVGPVFAGVSHMTSVAPEVHILVFVVLELSESASVVHIQIIVAVGLWTFALVMCTVVGRGAVSTVVRLRTGVVLSATLQVGRDVGGVRVGWKTSVTVLDGHILCIRGPCSLVALL